MDSRWWAYALSLVTATSAFGDAVVLSNGTIGGRIVAFDRASVVLSECEGGELRTISWAEVREISFAAGCAGTEDKMQRPQECADGLDSFVLRLANGQQIIAENAVLASTGQVHMDIFEPWEWAHGPAAEIRSVTRVRICRQSDLKVAPLPASFCREPRKIAVEFNYAAPFGNRIFTNGFAYSIQIAGEPPANFDKTKFGEEVRSAFQGAISLWTFSMSDRDALLTPAVRAFIRGRTRTAGSGYTLLTPPQVIQIECPHAATFTIQLSFAEGGLFPSSQPLLAKAQVEGRTIALNMRRYKCFRSDMTYDANKQLALGLAGGCINLVPVLAHELGHAFGIGHLGKPGSASLMDAVLSPAALTPTDEDISALVAVLEKSITGASPGSLDFAASEGGRPPKGFDEAPYLRRP